MFKLNLWEEEVRLLRRGEKVKIGEIYEDEEMVSNIILQNDGEYHHIDTKFINSNVNAEHLEKPVDVAAIIEEAWATFRFIKRHSDRFSRVSKVA